MFSMEATLYWVNGHKGKHTKNETGGSRVVRMAYIGELQKLFSWRP